MAAAATAAPRATEWGSVEEMSPDQLNAQVMEHVGRLVTYRAYPQSDLTKSWRRYTGVLQFDDHSRIYKIKQSPAYNYVPLSEKVTADVSTQIPTPGWIYTRLVPTTVFLSEYCAHLEHHVAQLTRENETLRAAGGLAAGGFPLTQGFAGGDFQQPPPHPGGGPPLPQPKWTIANVATWRLDDTVLVEVTRQKVASEAGYLPFAATPRIRLAWDALCQWMAAMAGIDGWVSMQEQVSLGNSLCRSFRQAIAEDVFHIPGSTIQRKLSADDHPDDPLGQVIQEMRSAGRGSNRSQGRGRGSYRLDASAFCRRCERVGHDQSQCFATRKKDGTWLSGNAQGGSAEKKKQ